MPFLGAACSSAPKSNRKKMLSFYVFTKLFISYLYYIYLSALVFILPFSDAIIEVVFFVFLLIIRDEIRK